MIRSTHVSTLILSTHIPAYNYLRSIFLIDFFLLLGKPLFVVEFFGIDTIRLGDVCHDLVLVHVRTVLTVEDLLDFRILCCDCFRVKDRE